MQDSTFHFSYLDNAKVIEEGAAKFNPDGYDKDFFFESPYTSMIEYLDALSEGEYDGYDDSFIVKNGIWKKQTEDYFFGGLVN